MKLFIKILWCINIILLVGCSLSLYKSCNQQKPEMIVCKGDSLGVDSTKIDSLLNGGKDRSK